MVAGLTLRMAACVLSTSTVDTVLLTRPAAPSCTRFREPGSSITQSQLLVLDSAGGRLATYATAELDPRLEYDQYLNAAVWDSREGWWLLLPTPDHALAFQGGWPRCGGGQQQ